jgi:TonB-dependent receptor
MLQPNFRSRGRFLIGASVLALGALIQATPAWADDTPTPKDEVVVTGIRQSLISAQKLKQTSSQLVDSVTAVDIGALPDRSVSEALQRIPGVTLQRTNENRDPARLAAEGGGVFIRGLPWVESQLNGRDVFSANNGRLLGFEDVSADLLSRVDVYKNPAADMIEGGIAGIVDLRTRKPFDQPGHVLALSGDYNYGDLRDKGFWSGNALFSDRWSTSMGEIGLLLSASIGNIGNRTDSIQTGRYEPRTNNAGATVYIPNSIGWRRIDWEQKRTAYDAAFQWRNEKWEFTAEAFYARATPHDIEHALGDVQGGFPADDPTYKFGSNGVITSGTLHASQLDADTRAGQTLNWTGDYSAHLQFHPDNHWTFSADGDYIRSNSKVYSMTAFTQLGNVPFSNAGRPDLNFNLAGDTPVLSLTGTPDLTRTDSAYWWAAAMDHLERNDAKEWAWRGDVQYDFNDDSIFKSFRVGVRGTEKDAITRQTGYNWNLLSQQFWGSGGGAPVYVNTTPGVASLFTYPNFFRGAVNLPGAAWFPAVGTVTQGTGHAYDLLKATESSGWGWTPLNQQAGCAPADQYCDAMFNNAHPAGDNVSSGVTDQTENTIAGYVDLRFDDKNFAAPFDGDIGVRLVHTKETAMSNAFALWPTLNGNPGVLTPAQIAFATGGFAPGVPVTHSYTDVLPSANIRFLLQPDLQLRFAASRAIKRPDFSQMIPYTVLSFNTTTGESTGTGGNPLLKPTSANQFDGSLEWYFAPTGSLTFDAFYKDIHNYVFAGDLHQPFTNNGQTITFDVTSQVNGASGTIKGFELAYQQFYDFLPGALSGLGLQANFTYVDSTGGVNTAVNLLEGPQVTNAADATLPLEGISKYSFNVIGMYEKYGISARLAYNWRSSYLLTTSAANIQRPVWYEDYGQLDGSVFYTINKHVKVGVQATNILNTRTFLDVGGSTLKPRYSWTDTDRRIAGAIRMVF